MSGGPVRRPGGTWTDVIFGALAISVFSAALWQTTRWGFRTAMFPQMVTTGGLVLSALFLGVTVFRIARRSPRAEPVGDVGAGRTTDEEDFEIEYVFETAGRAAWTQALAWIAVLLAVLLLGGLFAATAVFAFTYLLWAARRSWYFSAIYAAVLTLLLYVSLRVLLVVPVPEGLLA